MERFAPLTMAIAMPAWVTFRAAASLVAMPPVPRLLPLPPAISIRLSVISSTRGIRRASGFSRGLPVYRPSISLTSTSASASTRRATVADRLSLSPKRISSTATVSFSLTMGTTPSSSSRWKVLWTFCRRSSCSTASPVSSTWETVWPYSEKNLS